MKFFISILALVTIVSTNAFAQYNDTEISGKLGMAAGALNFGADYVKTRSDYGYGGYVFVQSSRDRNSAQVVNGEPHLVACSNLSSWIKALSKLTLLRESVSQW